MNLIQVADGMTLRTPLPEDAEAVFALITANRTVLQHRLPALVAIQSLQDCQQYLDFLISGHQTGHFLSFLLCIAGHPAGMLCLFALDGSARRADLGYWLDAAWQGQGIMTQACQALISQAFSQLGFYRLQISCMTDNQASRRLALRLGFQLEGILAAYEWQDQTPCDHALYSLLLPQWHARSSAP